LYRVFVTDSMDFTSTTFRNWFLSYQIRQISAK